MILFEWDKSGIKLVPIATILSLIGDSPCWYTHYAILKYTEVEYRRADAADSSIYRSK
jgi:hypothetical protein